MKSNPFWKAASITLTASLVLSACAPAATPAPAATSTVAPAADALTLRWRTRPDNAEEIKVYSDVSKEVEAKFGGRIKLVYEPGGSETASYQDVLKTEIGAGTAPDVFWIPGTDIADFASRGLILDLKPIAGNFDTNAFYPGPMFHLTYNPTTQKTGEALWGLPRDVSTFALYLNLDLLAEAGLTGDKDPRELAKQGKWDWAAFYEAAQAIRALGADVYGYGANAWWGPYGVWLNGAGGGFFNADRSACALDSAASIQGLEFQASLYLPAETAVAVPYGEDSEPPFRAGKVGMFQNGRWATPGIRQVSFNWDVVELPKGPSGGPGNWLFWGAYVVNGKITDPARQQAAWELVQALTQADIQGKVAALGANVPSRVSSDALNAFLGFTPPANNQAFLNGLSQQPATEGPLWAGSWPDFSKAMDAGLSGVLTGKTTVAEFQSSICAEANRAFTAP